MITEPVDSSNFARVARTSTIKVGLKPLIPRRCFNLLMQIRREALGEYQVSSASHSPVWPVTFMTLAKASRADELCHTSPKYCATRYQNIAKHLTLFSVIISFCHWQMSKFLTNDNPFLQCIPVKLFAIKFKYNKNVPCP